MTERDDDARGEKRQRRPTNQRRPKRRRQSKSRRATMADVSHTNPYTNETFGGVYRRGPAVADGGKPAAHAIESTDPPAETGSADSRSDIDEVTDASEKFRSMADVDHTPPNENVNDVWNRGSRDPGVASD